MTSPEYKKAVRRFDRAQKKVQRARQALANAEERRNYAHVELREQERRDWLLKRGQQ